MRLTFPVQFVIGSQVIHAHFILESLAYMVGFQLMLFLRRRKGDSIRSLDRAMISSAAVFGAAIGSIVLGRLETHLWTWQGGKTIVGGLVGGLLCVEFAKKALRISVSTGDVFALPIAVGTFIGRLGCFLEGLADHTYGLATSLPWGIDFGDGIRRHPTQLYEVAIMLAVFALLWRWRLRDKPVGWLFGVYLLFAGVERFLIEFLRAKDDRLLGPLTVAQVASMVLIVIAASLIAKYSHSPSPDPGPYLSQARARD